MNAASAAAGQLIQPSDEHLFQGIRLWRDVHRHVRGLLDIQIVSASLRDIGGGLSAGNDETTWVQTSYLIAEIIVIPLSGWLTRTMSTRWLFAFSAAGFTLTSLLCGLAWNIQSMIVFRPCRVSWAAR
jgi:DHA2 family multidrug resistance protein